MSVQEIVKQLKEEFSESEWADVDEIVRDIWEFLRYKGVELVNVYEKYGNVIVELSGDKKIVIPIACIVVIIEDDIKIE